MPPSKPYSPTLQLPSPPPSAPLIDLPQPGAPSFTRQLYATLARAPSLNGWIPDPSLFSTLLLALIVKQGGVLVDAPKKSARAAGKEAVTILRCIFGLEPIVVRCDETTDPTSFARAITCESAGRRDRPITTPSRKASRLSRMERSATSSFLGRLSESPARMSEHEAERRASGRRPSSGDRLDRSCKAKEIDIASRPIAQAIVIRGLERAGATVAMELVENLNRGWIEYAGVQRDLRDALVVWVRADGKEAPFWLVDEFACSVSLPDAETPPELEPAALVPPAYLLDLRNLLDFTHVHPPLHTHMTNLLSSLILHPRLSATITARASKSLGALVRAHRLLQGDFELPARWVTELRRWARSAEIPLHHAGGKYAGGRGGVDTWARRAGEKPDVADLRGEGAGEDEGGDDWYALPRNVAGVWVSAFRHRVKFRQRGDESLWVLVGSARERAWGGGRGKTKDRSREIEDALEEMLGVV
ncbi:hypothetical protein Q5752_006722 [Cryptotrichosporon argae]